MACKVAIVDDAQGVLELFKAGLETTPGFACSGCYRCAEDALVGIPGRATDVVIMDIFLPGLSGIDATYRLKSLMPNVRVIMLSGHCEPGLVFKSLAAGASGYLVKPFSLIDSLAAIRDVLGGDSALSRQAVRGLVDVLKNSEPIQPNAVKLSQREAEILALIIQERRDKEIAEKLGIELTTVRTHMRRLFEKLRARNRKEAIAKYCGLAPGNGVREDGA